jgi:putative chitinase
MTQINRAFFFTHVRRMMFSNILQQSQVDGMNAILDGWEAKYTADDDRWLAYALATTYHETDQHMQPINEYGKGRGRPYGKVDPTTGQVYYGRGFVQLTWERNYETMSNLLEIDFVHLALELDNATNIMFLGMAKGLFTGKSLSDYFCKTNEDWVSTRKIINGLDKAQAIALYRAQFLLGDQLHDRMSSLGNHRAHGDAERVFDPPCAALFSPRAQNW